MFFEDLDPYAVLGMPPTAGQTTIKAAYRALARRYHPDTSSSDAARRWMILINRAWEVLGDPARRAQYDGRRVGQGTATSDAPPPDAVPPRPPDWMARHAPHHGPASGWGAGAAGPPPGRPSGSVLEFGIYLGWSLGEVTRVDPLYLDWLADRPDGRRYLGEIAALRGRPAPEAERQRRFG